MALPAQAVIILISALFGKVRRNCNHGLWQASQPSGILRPRTCTHVAAFIVLPVGRGNSHGGDPFIARWRLQRKLLRRGWRMFDAKVPKSAISVTPIPKACHLRKFNTLPSSRSEMDLSFSLTPLHATRSGRKPFPLVRNKHFLS